MAVVNGTDELALWYSELGLLKAGYELENPVVRPKIGPVTIAVEHAKGTLRKITKIVPYRLPDGGFAVMMPYHEANEGLLYKAQAFDTLSHSLILPRPTVAEAYRVSSKAKLSLHSDGTTQFSSMNGHIISGKDPQTGEFKGLGIIAHPFAQPVTSGPTLAIDAWRLEEFQEQDPTGSVLLFTQEQLRDPFMQTSSSCVRVEIYALSRRDPLASRGYFPNYSATMRVWNKHLGTFGTREIRLIALHNPEVALGVFVAHMPNIRQHSGFSLAGRRDVQCYGLYAEYPISTSVHTHKSLDFTGSS